MRLTLLIGSSQLDSVRSALPDMMWHAPLTVPLSQSRALLVGEGRT